MTKSPFFTNKHSCIHHVFTYEGYRMHGLHWQGKGNKKHHVYNEQETGGNENNIDMIHSQKIVSKGWDNSVIGVLIYCNLCINSCVYQPIAPGWLLVEISGGATGTLLIHQYIQLWLVLPVRSSPSVRWVTPMLMLSAENMGRGTELKFWKSLFG